jgi:hypothetical protein
MLGSQYRTIKKAANASSRSRLQHPDRLHCQGTGGQPTRAHLARQRQHLKLERNLVPLLIKPPNMKISNNYYHRAAAARNAENRIREPVVGRRHLCHNCNNIEAGGHANWGIHLISYLYTAIYQYFSRPKSFGS